MLNKYWVRTNELYQMYHIDMLKRREIKQMEAMMNTADLNPGAMKNSGQNYPKVISAQQDGKLSDSSKCKL